MRPGYQSSSLNIGDQKINKFQHIFCQCHPVLFKKKICIYKKNQKNKTVGTEISSAVEGKELDVCAGACRTDSLQSISFRKFSYV